MFLNLKGTFLFVSQKEKSGRRFSTFAKATADKGKRVMGFRLIPMGYAVTS